MASKGFAVVTGASTGIGYELAKCCVEDGYDVLICADEPEIERAAEGLRTGGGRVETVQADVGTAEGIEALMSAIGDRPVDALLANAGTGLGGAFLDQPLSQVTQVVEVNINGVLRLVHRIGRQMRARNSGRILITGSIAGFMPGSFMAVYNATKAFLDNFSYALANELKETGVTVTCLMPGPTDTAFFDRAHMEDTPLGSMDSKADPAKVARDGYEAMQKGETGEVSGFMNKLQAAFAGVIPDKIVAEMHRKMAKPFGRR